MLVGDSYYISGFMCSKEASAEMVEKSNTPPDPPDKLILNYCVERIVKIGFKLSIFL